MSFEPDSAVADNPIATADPPKSSKKFWLFGGCGCLLVILLICGGFGAVAFMMGKPFYDLMQESMAFIPSSQVIEEKLGTPISTGPPVQSQSGQETVRMDVPVEGPNGKGTVVMVFKIDSSTWKWSREEFYLEVDGAQFNLNPDEELNLDIDDGMDGLEDL